MITQRIILAFLVLILSACNLFPGTPTIQAEPQALSTNPHNPPEANQPASSDPVLLFSIGMHIEPLGTTHQGYKSSQGNYQDIDFFNRHVKDILMVTDMVSAHHGRMTIQAQSPFTEIVDANRNPILSDLAASGHEIALHFHEDAHLGKKSTTLAIDEWCRVMKEEISLVRQASGVANIRYWSGGNLYPDLLQAAACAGLTINSDWKNPQTQSTDASLVGVHPWKPAGGTDGTSFTLFSTHDPDGKVIFLPEGQYDRGNFAAMRRSEAAGGDEAYFKYLEQSLMNSLAAAKAGQVNVFHFTVHPAEFRGDPQHPFAVIDTFLSQVVDPLVAAGKVKWATFGQMADAFTAWENAHSITTPAVSRGYISFVINVHDWVNAGASADTLIRLVDLFDKYRVSADFYMTAPVVEKYATERPDVISRLAASSMTISYHVRPPHPLYTGFDSRLKGLSDAALYLTLMDYETFALDLTTGNLDRSRPGGYAYVAQVFGVKPVTAAAPNHDRRIKETAQRVYTALGARMTVLYHEEGTDLALPLVYSGGMLVRPSDFSITRIPGSENFWWNFMSSPRAAEMAPTHLLQVKLAEWDAERQPFITVLIHENNFYRAGPESWTPIYFAGSDKSLPLAPPFNLSAPDTSKPRTTADQNAIWNAYEHLVAYAAENLEVITSTDLVMLAAAGH